MAPPDTLFISYTSPGKLSREDRRRVAHYIGKNHRNRSKPSRRNRGGLSFVNEGEAGFPALRAIDDTLEPPQSGAESSRSSTPASFEQAAEQSTQISLEISGLQPSIVRDGHGVWSDPFASLPLETRGNVNQITQFCTYGLPR